MTANKHTPGKWYTHRSGFSTIYVEARIGGGMVQEVAACGPTEAGPEQQEANARLIAAAPELLEALTKLTSFVVTDVVDSCNGNKCREPWCAGCFGEEVAEQTVREAREALDAARAAIAKATGGAA